MPYVEKGKGYLGFKWTRYNFVTSKVVFYRKLMPWKMKEKFLWRTYTLIPFLLHPSHQNITSSLSFLLCNSASLYKRLIFNISRKNHTQWALCVENLCLAFVTLSKSIQIHFFLLLKIIPSNVSKTSQCLCSVLLWVVLNYLERLCIKFISSDIESLS